MSDDSKNMFHWSGDAYASKDVCEAAITEAVITAIKAMYDDAILTVKCGDKTLQVRVDVTVLTGKGRPVGSKNAPKDASAPKLTSPHYVAELGDGTLEYRNAKDALTPNVEAGNAGHVARLFAFNTKLGAMYAIARNTVAERTCAWEAPVVAAAE